MTSFYVMHIESNKSSISSIITDLKVVGLPDHDILAKFFVTSGSTLTFWPTKGVASALCITLTLKWLFCFHSACSLSAELNPLLIII